MSNLVARNRARLLGAKAQMDETGRYTFRLESLHIENTRAVHNDTDVVALALKVDDITFPPQTRDLGDVNNGTHAIGLKFENVLIDVDLARSVSMAFWVNN